MESYEAHRNTLKLIEEAKINFVHVFPFSPREGTPAAKMKLLSTEVITERAKEIRNLGHKNKMRHLKSMINKFIFSLRGPSPMMVYFIFLFNLDIAFNAYS